ncbi:MAG: NADH:ubiquinone oxidoreductase subunit NDUFA12 [Rhodobacteraceae bacterium]|nr:NADH:ubiquinone oxidoreductase subunit NDUFA12 [Paracoccaceae bacterium]
MKFILRMLTWWNGQSFGTQIFTWRNGVLVGEDALGNKYFTNKDKSKRWVIYDGPIEGSRVSPDWHGWLHHTFDECPGTTPLPRKSWEKSHVPNMSGTNAAYHPPGSILSASSAKTDYEAWQPE